MFTRLIYPLSLRQKVGYRVMNLYTILRDKNISLTFNRNLRLDLSTHDIGHKAIIVNGFYELGLTKRMVQLAKKGGLLADVGANYGYYSCLWAAASQENKVLAFEASPLNIAPLKNNIEKNLLTNRIEIVQLALSKEPGNLRFDLKNENQQTGWGGLSIGNNANSINVKTNTLDNYAFENSIDKIDVLKIDTEGADTWVLYGAKKLLNEKKISHIFFEQNTERMKLLNIQQFEAKTFLEDAGYKVEEESATEFYAYPK